MSAPRCKQCQHSRRVHMRFPKSWGPCNVAFCGCDCFHGEGNEAEK